MTKNIWIITEYYFPSVISSGYYMTEVAEFLALKEKKVNVICTSSSYNKKEKVKLKKKEKIKGVNILRVFPGKINKNNFISRTFGLFWSSLLLFVKTIYNVKRGDELLVVTNPAFLILFLPFIKKIKKIEYSILIHDIFPENLSAIGSIKSSSFFYKFLKNLFDFSYSCSKNCIAIGRDMESVIRSKIKDNSSNVVLIPNWADTLEVLPLRKENTNLFNKFNLKGKFIFQFAGNLGYSQGLDNILKAIELIDNPDLHFLFIGTGAKENTISEFADNAPLKNVTYVGFIDRKEQNDFLNVCDVAIVTLSEGMFGLGVPSKSYNIMAAGKPIIIVADKNSEISLVVKEHNIGWTINPNNPEMLRDTFINAYNNKKEINGIGEKSRKVAEVFFAKEIILEKYYKLFNEV